MLNINTNNGAILSTKAAKNASKMMDEAMIRLSTGKKLNSAKDDPGSLSVAIRMTAEINSLTTSLKNASDAQSAIDTGEAALSRSTHTFIKIKRIGCARHLQKLRLQLIEMLLIVKLLLWKRKLTGLAVQQLGVVLIS